MTDSGGESRRVPRSFAEENFYEPRLSSQCSGRREGEAIRDVGTRRGVPQGTRVAGGRRGVVGATAAHLCPASASPLYAEPMSSPTPSLLPTQRPLTDAELRELLAPVGTLASHRLLSGGTFSAAQAAMLTDGTEVVVKTSVPERALPDGRTPLLTYEHDMLRAERDMLERLADVDGVPAPRVLHSDFSRRVTEVDAVVMTRIPGTPWDTVAETMSQEANDQAWRQVGEIIAAMQTVTGRRFGYPARDFALGAATWPEFIDALFAAAVADASEWDVDIEPERVLAAVDTVRPHLEEVTEPRLVHNDLWPGNVLLNPTTGEVFGVVDFERALFGDRLQDFCGSESMNTGRNEPAYVAGYVGAGGPTRWVAEVTTASGLDPAAHARLTLYRLWAMSVQFTEIVPRGFSGEWVVGHRATILANRAELFRQLGV